MAVNPRISGLLLLGQLVENPAQMEILQVKRVAQMVQKRRGRRIEDLGK
jgi:hypothetical protein